MDSMRYGMNCIELHWIAISLSYLFISIPMSVISTLWKLGVLMVLSTQPGTALVTMQTRPKLLATCVAMRHCEPREKMGSMNISVTYPIYYNMIHGGPELCAIASCSVMLYPVIWYHTISHEMIPQDTLHVARHCFECDLIFLDSMSHYCFCKIPYYTSMCVYI